jgi:diacylglycerol kinase (ATP)
MTDPTPSHPPIGPDPSASAPVGEPRGRLPVPEFDERRLQLQLDDVPGITAQAGRRGTKDKFVAGVRGLKHAIRGDSSFFAHFYRGVMIASIAALRGVNQWSWCLLILGGSLVLLAELCHSAVDTLARAIGDPDEPRLTIAREIAAAGVLVVAFSSGAVTVIVLSWKLAQQLGWVR